MNASARFSNEEDVGHVSPALTKAHLPQLDGLRGIAIALVIFYHYGLLNPARYAMDIGIVVSLSQAGWMGVDLFFVLSGFLITNILIETRGSPHYLRNFLARRFLRIWPLYYLILAAFFILAPVVLRSVPGELQQMADQQVWFWLYAANWLFAFEGGFTHTPGGYFWSLAVEEQFYLIWPFVILMCARQRFLGVCLGLAVSSLVLRLILAGAGVPNASLYNITFTHIDALCVGAALAVAYKDERLWSAVVRYRWRGIVASVVLLSIVRYLDGSFYFWNDQMTRYGLTIIAVLFGSFTVLSINSRPGERLFKVLSSPALVSLGRYSYAIYLIHVPVGVVLHNALTRVAGAEFEGPYGQILFWAFFVLASTTSWFLGMLSWHCLEKRILRLKRFFAYQG